MMTAQQLHRPCLLCAAARPVVLILEDDVTLEELSFAYLGISENVLRLVIAL